MSERAWQWVELVGHWTLAWTVVVAGVAVWLRLGRPVRVALRYWGWFWATFAGAALAPMVLAVGPLLSWRDALGLIRPGSTPPAGSSARFVSWFEGYTAVAHHDVPEAPRGRENQQPGPAPESRGQGLAFQASTEPAGPEDRWLSIALMAWAAGFAGFAARLAWAACASGRSWRGVPHRCLESGKTSCIRPGTRWGSVARYGWPSIPRSRPRCAWDCSGR